MGQHKVAKAIKEKHVIKFQKFDSPKNQKLTLIINGLRSLPRPYGMVLTPLKRNLQRERRFIRRYDSP